MYYICNTMLDAPVSFRAKKDNKDYMVETAEENGISLSDLYNYMTEHYIQSGDIIKFAGEIKRAQKKK